MTRLSILTITLLIATIFAAPITNPNPNNGLGINGTPDLGLTRGGSKRNEGLGINGSPDVGLTRGESRRSTDEGFGTLGSSDTVLIIDRKRQPNEGLGINGSPGVALTRGGSKRERDEGLSIVGSPDVERTTDHNRDAESSNSLGINGFSGTRPTREAPRSVPKVFEAGRRWISGGFWKSFRI